jgi:hypothetical protein
MTVSFLRHNSFFSPQDAQDFTLNIIGVGATGSWVGLLAAKMGWHNFQVWDADTVESHNCPNQIYNLSQVGSKKVDAFETTLKEFNPDIIVTKHDCFFEAEKHADCLSDYVFVAVDTNTARKDILGCLISNPSVDLVFESKMGFNHAVINVIDPFDTVQIEGLQSALLDDSEVPESACNARIMTTLTTIVASNIAHVLCNHCSSSRRNTVFTYKKNTVLSLDQTLNLYAS